MSMGVGNKTIAEMMGYSPQMVSIVRNSKVTREKLGELGERKDAEVVGFTTRLKKYADEALDIMGEIMNNEMTPESVRVSAAKDILDRAGHGAIRRLSVGIGVLTPERISEIKERAQRAVFEQEVIDIDYDPAERSEAGEREREEVLEAGEREESESGSEPEPERAVDQKSEDESGTA